MDKNARIYVAGHCGMVGSAIIRKLRACGYHNIVVRSHQELDLTNQICVENFFTREKPEYIFLAAAKVGGIGANTTFPACFIKENIQIQTNVIDAAHHHQVRKLLFLGSACIYPRDCLQPIKESYLLQGKLETSNEAYAIAKIAGIKMCEAYHRQYGCNFISVMPANLYGPGDNFDLENSHVIPALIRKFHEAKDHVNPEVTLWGTGKAKREFMFVEDLADACLFLMNNYDEPDIINVGSGEEYSIKELADIISNIVGFKGHIVWDADKPDGNPRRLLDCSKIKRLGWQPCTSIKEGIYQTYRWFTVNY